jgi:hypothetical protein
MANFLVLEIYLLLLFGDGEGVGGIFFSMAALLKIRVRDNYDVSNFTGMTTWRLFFPDSDTAKAEMMSLPWNNFSTLFSVLL